MVRIIGTHAPRFVVTLAYRAAFLWPRTARTSGRRGPGCSTRTAFVVVVAFVFCHGCCCGCCCCCGCASKHTAQYTIFLSQVKRHCLRTNATNADQCHCQLSRLGIHAQNCCIEPSAQPYCCDPVVYSTRSRRDAKIVRRALLNIPVCFGIESDRCAHRGV